MLDTCSGGRRRRKKKDPNPKISTLITTSGTDIGWVNSSLFCRYAVTRLTFSLQCPVKDGVSVLSVVGAAFGEKAGPNVVGTRPGIDLRRIYADEFVRSGDVTTFMQVAWRTKHIFFL